MLKHSPFIMKLEADMKPVLAAIEKRGLITDTAKMRQIISCLRENRTLAEINVYDLLETSKRINLNSTAELSNLLVELDVNGSNLTQTKSGNFSAAKDVLEKIEHPAIEHIIEYRSLTRLISSLESYLHALGLIDNRLYYKFTNYCPSGRLYTKDMSVQNLPHEGRYELPSTKDTVDKFKTLEQYLRIDYEDKRRFNFHPKLLERTGKKKDELIEIINSLINKGMFKWKAWSAKKIFKLIRNLSSKDQKELIGFQPQFLVDETFDDFIDSIVIKYLAKFHLSPSVYHDEPGEFKPILLLQYKFDKMNPENMRKQGLKMFSQQIPEWQKLEETRRVRQKEYYYKHASK